MESTDNGAPGSEKSKPLEQSVEDLSKGPPSSLAVQPKSRHLTIKYVGPMEGRRVGRVNEFNPGLLYPACFTWALGVVGGVAWHQGQRKGLTQSSGGGY